MYRLIIPALSFSLLVTLVMAADKNVSPVGPLTTAQQQPSPAAQQGCKTAGDIALTMAKLRDDGKSLRYALKLIVDAKPNVGPQMFQTFEYIAAYAYDRPWLKPDAIQQEMQTHCLQTSDIAPLERLKGNFR
jgi:hypothetical protein